MPKDFKLPELGENIESGDIVSVLVKEGDDIAANQGVLEIETGKATVELPCPHAGRVSKIHVKAGQTVPVGGMLLTVDDGGKEAAAKPAPAKAKAGAKPAAKPAPPAEPESAPQAAAAPAAEEQAPPVEPDPPAAADPAPAAAEKPTKRAEAPANASPAGPATRRLARELGVDLSRVTGSGPSGRITEEDVKKAVRESSASAPLQATKRGAALPNAVAAQDNWGPVQVQPLSKIRKTIAANMARSSSTIPHVTNFDDADITELERIRKGSMVDYVGADAKLTMMPFVMKAVSHSLRLHPVINASLDLEHDRITYKDYVNLGVAVDTDRGLVVPVLRDVDRLTIPQIAQALAEMTQKSRANQLGLDDMRGGTFTISNLGAIGGTYSTPIINHPEVAILLLGRSRKLPVVVDDEIKIRLMMPLSLSYDHRLVDGAAAARFLNDVKNYLQAPGRLFLAP